METIHVERIKKFVRGQMGFSQQLLRLGAAEDVRARETNVRSDADVVVQRDPRTKGITRWHVRHAAKIAGFCNFEEEVLYFVEHASPPKPVYPLIDEDLPF